MGLLEKFAEEKLVEYGASTIMGLVASSPIGIAVETVKLFSEFIESDGMLALSRLASGEIRGLEKTLAFKYKGSELLHKMKEVFDRAATEARAPDQADKQGGWGASESRQDWLTNRWQHDWRSQPREPAGSMRMTWTRAGVERKTGGEFIPGRLDFPVPGAPAIGKGKQRSSRRRRRINRYKRYGRMAARSSRGGQDGN